MEKIKLCLEDEDFCKYIKRQFGSLRKREDLMDCIQEIKPDFTFKQEKLMYPSVSILDEFMLKKGI